MKRVFHDYGAMIVTVIAVVALIGLTVFLMRPGSVMANAFSAITGQFVDAADEMIGGDGGSGSSGAITAELNEYGFYFEQPYKVTIDDVGDVDLVFYEDGICIAWMYDAQAGDFLELMGMSGTLTYSECAASCDGETLITFSEDGTECTYDGMTAKVEKVARNGVQTGVSYYADPNGLLNLGGTYVLTFNENGTATLSVDGIAINELLFTDGGNTLTMPSFDGSETLSCPVYPDGSKVALNFIVFVYDKNACRHEHIETKDLDATCEDDGYTGAQVCTDCGATVNPGTVIPAAHTYVENMYICDVCGYENITDYTLTASDYLAKTGVDISSGNVVIPELFLDTDGSGYRVVSIGKNAFKDCSGLTSVEIPDSVTSISDSAFWNCTSLTSVTFGDNSQLNSLGNYTFQYCENLTSIEIPDGVSSIGNQAFYTCTSLGSIEIPDGVTSIGTSVFSNCSSLASVTFGSNSQLTSISGSAFGDCTSLTSIEIPASVTSIGNYAFSGCTSLESIEIPDGVSSIGKQAFYNCTSLTSVTFGDNSQLTSIGEWVFAFSGLTNIELPVGVSSIGYAAFQDCDGLTSFEIPASVTSINGTVFLSCSNLRSVEIPSSVTSIGNSAFGSCTSLESIIFNGTKAQWNAITLDNNWEYDIPATQVVCSDGTVALS